MNQSQDSKSRPRVGIASLGAAVGGLAMALVLTQCVPAAKAQTPSSERIVAAGGAVTEILYALGLNQFE